MSGLVVCVPVYVRLCICEVEADVNTRVCASECLDLVCVSVCDHPFVCKVVRVVNVYASECLECVCVPICVCLWVCGVVAGANTRV